MTFDIDIRGELTEVELPDGTHSMGGGDADVVRIPGLPVRLFELRVEGARLMVSSPEPFGVDDVLSPGGVPRLVMAGERIQLGDGILLRTRATRGEGARAGTAKVLKELLGGLAEPEESGCASLTCLTGLDVGRCFALAGDQVEVGRGDTVDLRIRDRAVSRRHARIRRAGTGGYTIEDLGSPNGLYVNGLRVRGPRPLDEGAVIELGHSLLRFRAGAKEPSPPPAEPPQPPAAGTPEADDASGAITAEPSGRDPEPSASPAPRARLRLEHALMGLGAGLAVLGALVTWNFLAG